MTAENDYHGDDPFFDYKNKPRSICKYLGVADDPDTYFQYVSSWNYCHRPESIQSLIPTHQADFCLSNNHSHCPVFQDSWDGTFPKRLMALSSPGRASRHNLSPRERSAGRQRLLLGGLFVFAALAGLIFLLAWSRPVARNRTINFFRGLTGGEPIPLAELGETPIATQALPPSQTPPPSSTLPPSLTPAPAGTLPPSITPAPSETPLPIDTPFPTPGPGLETPFGPADQFVIHIVAPGESFTSIASTFSTTVEMLQRVNPSIEGTSLWVGRQLVVPIGASSADDLPEFRVVFTTEAVLLSDLAEQYGSDTEQIRYFNQLGDSDSILSGRWLIIPVLR